MPTTNYAWPGAIQPGGIWPGAIQPDDSGSPPTDITGDASVTLLPITPVATGILAIQAAASVTLSPITPASSASVAIQGAASVTLDPITPSATGSGQALSIGDASATLPPITPVATATLAIQATASVTLLPITPISAGVIVGEITGSGSVTLSPITPVATGTILIRATASVTLSPVTPLATGTVGVPAPIVNALRFVSRITTRLTFVSKIITALDLRPGHMSTEAQTPHVGDAGTLIIVQVTKEDGLPMDLTSIQSAVIKTSPVGGGTKVLTASVYGNPTDGNLSARTTGSTWDYPGVWQAYGRVVFDEDNQWRGEAQEYTVGV